MNTRQLLAAAIAGTLPRMLPAPPMFRYRGSRYPSAPRTPMSADQIRAMLAVYDRAAVRPPMPVQVQTSDGAALAHFCTVGAAFDWAERRIATLRRAGRPVPFMRVVEYLPAPIGGYAVRRVMGDA